MVGKRMTNDDSPALRREIVINAKLSAVVNPLLHTFVSSRLSEDILFYRVRSNNGTCRTVRVHRFPCRDRRQFDAELFGIQAGVDAAPRQ